MMKSTRLMVSLLSTVLLATAAPLEQHARADTTYDVIVVGSGPAGIIVADRMSEAGKNVLLLEQGGPSYYITGGRERPDWLSGTNLSRVDVPGLYSSIFSNGGSLICPSNIVSAYQGCAVGGNSAINAGLFFQPPASDWDTYFPSGWHNADMQSAINKLYAMQPSTDNPSSDGRRYLQSGYDTARKWLVQGAGYKEVSLNTNHTNHTKTKVFGHPVYSSQGGQRSGPVKTYLQSALARSNFALRTGTKAIRVVRSGSTATGVQVSTTGSTTVSTININPGGRIILSAGALLSPQLLMWSGIGDSATLQKLAASGRVLLPSSQWINNTAIGDKLFDNPNTFIELYSTSIASYSQSYASPIPADRDLYLKSRSGPYSFAGQTSAFWDYIPSGTGLVGCQGTIGINGFGDYTQNGTVTLNVYGTSGLRSVGHVGLNDNGIATPTSNFYSDSRDAQAIATFIYNIFKALPTGLAPRNIAASSTIQQIVTYITTPSQYTLGNVNHWSSSCRIGTCVDADTKVIGMSNLHVVDASISAPLTTNPAFGTMAIAERAVERILALSKKKTA